MYNSCNIIFNFIVYLYLFQVSQYSEVSIYWTYLFSYGGKLKFEENSN